MKNSISEEIKGNVNFIGTGGVARASSNSQDIDLDPKSKKLLSLLYVLLGFTYSSLKEKMTEYQSYDKNGFAQTPEVQRDQLAAEIVSEFPELGSSKEELHNSTFDTLISKCFAIAGLDSANTSIESINPNILEQKLASLKIKLASSTGAYARAKTNRLEKFIRMLISSNFIRNTEIQSLLLSNFKEFAEAKSQNKPRGTIQLARNLFEKLPGYLIFASLYDFGSATAEENSENLKIFIKNYVQFTTQKANEESLFQLLDLIGSDATTIPALPGSPGTSVPLSPTIKASVKFHLVLFRTQLEALLKELNNHAKNFDPFLADRNKILDPSAKNILPDYPQRFVEETKIFQTNTTSITKKMFKLLDKILSLIKKYFTVDLGSTITDPVILNKFKESYDFKYQKKRIQLNQSGSYFSKMKNRANAKSTYAALREITKFVENNKKFPSSFNRPVAENKILIDLNKLKENSLNESYVRMYGNWIKMILGALLGNFSIPVTVKGSEKDVMAFAAALNSETKYLKAAQKYGLTDNRTYSVKSTLDNSVKKFEKETGLIWPFK